MLTRKSGILALILGVSVFGAACEEKTTTPPVVIPVAVNIVPETVNPINVGQTVALFANVTGATNQAVTWTSSNTTVADVSSAGVVTAKAAGTATITAKSVEDPTKADAVQIQVNPGTPPVIPGTPTISIAQVNIGGTLVPVNPGNVAGVVDVIMNVDVPAGVSASAVRVQVVNAAGVATEVCRQTFTGGSTIEASASTVPVQINCSINTALLENGNPRFPNGTYTIRAEVLNATNVALATAVSQPYVFNNVNNLGITATADCAGATTCPNTDAAGLSWTTGNLTVTVAPAIFTGATNNVASGTVTVRDANTGAVIAQAPLGTASATGGFSVTFTKAANATNGLLDVSEAESPITVEVTTITTSGNQGTSFGTPGFGSQVGVNPLRLDNQRPDDTDADADVASFNNPNWFSTTTSLTGANRVTNLAELSDEGVNRNTVTLQYNTNPAATNTSTGWTSFTDVSVLPETTTSTQYAFRAVVCDALGNCTNVGPVLSGVDRSAPSIAVQAGSAANNSVNPTAEIGITGTDVISGAQIVRATVSGRSVFEIDANADTDLRCYNTAGGLVSTNPTTNGGACASSDVTTVAGPGATETQATVVIPADENWYTIEIVTVDVAGNLSTTVVTRNNLVDAEVPTATIASTTITGTNSSISGTVQDNIQVMQYDPRFQFALTTLPDFVPFSSPTVVDATLDNTLTGQAAASASSTLVVRSIEEAVNGAAITPTAYGFGVFDMANNFGFNGTGISFGAGNGVANDATYALTASPATLCRSGTAACTNTANTSTTLTLDVTTVAPATPTTPFDNPIARVYWYYVHSGADNTIGTADDYLVLISTTEGSTATFETSAVTGVRTFTMNSTVAASAFPRTGTFTIAALAVDSEGDAVLSTTTVPVQ